MSKSISNVRSPYSAITWSSQFDRSRAKNGFSRRRPLLYLPPNNLWMPSPPSKCRNHVCVKKKHQKSSGRSRRGRRSNSPSSNLIANINSLNLGTSSFPLQQRPSLPSPSSISVFPLPQTKSGAEGIRTPDPLLAKQVLSLLSYSPTMSPPLPLVKPSGLPHSTHLHSPPRQTPPTSASPPPKSSLPRHTPKLTPTPVPRPTLSSLTPPTAHLSPDTGDPTKPQPPVAYRRCACLFPTRSRL